MTRGTNHIISDAIRCICMHFVVLYKNNEENTYICPYMDTIVTSRFLFAVIHPKREL